MRQQAPSTGGGPAHQPVILTERLAKSYGRRRGLDGLDLEVRAGEVFGYLGPNGAGKASPSHRAAAEASPYASRQSCPHCPTWVGGDGGRVVIERVGPGWDGGVAVPACPRPDARAIYDVGSRYCLVA
jgi:hypothetical protein